MSALAWVRPLPEGLLGWSDVPTRPRCWRLLWRRCHHRFHPHGGFAFAQLEALRQELWPSVAFLEPMAPMLRRLLVYCETIVEPARGPLLTSQNDDRICFWS